MMWHAVYRISDGTLVSIGSVIAGDLAARGLASKSYPERPVGAWNTATQDFDASPVNYGKIDAFEFMMRFTEAERGAIRASAVPAIEDFRDVIRLSRSVNLDSPYIQSVLSGLEVAGLLTAPRVVAILEG